MIEYKTHNKNSLLEYINGDQFGLGNDIPITKHRAISQCHNPRLDDEDIILIIALENGILVGYLGILPDLIYYKENQPEKIGCVTCLWVSPTVRGKSVSSELLKIAIHHWNKKLFLGDYVPFTKKIYDRSGDFLIQPYQKQGVRLYVLSDLHTILPPKKLIFEKTKSLLKIIDTSLNIFIKIKHKFNKQRLEHLTFEYNEEIDDESQHFIELRQQNQLFRREKPELNWMLKYPWVLSAENKDELNCKYYFSSTAKSFSYRVVKIRNLDNKLIGLLIFSIRDFNLKLPYLYHDQNLDDIVMAINYHIIKWQIKTFTTYDEDLAKRILHLKSPAFHKRVVTRNYLLSKDLDTTTFFHMKMQDGDGDCGFT